MLSSDGAFKIQFVSWAEPNNGRMLWQINIFLNDILINKKVFENEWNYINFEINKLQINDVNDTFYYLPAEGKSKLIEKETHRIIDLPSYGASTVRFYGNKFQFNKLLQIYSDTIVVTEIDDFTHYCFEKDFDGYIIDGTFLNRKVIEVEYYVIENKERKVFTKEIVFNKFIKIELTNPLEKKN